MGIIYLVKTRSSDRYYTQGYTFAPFVDIMVVIKEIRLFCLFFPWLNIGQRFLRVSVVLSHRFLEFGAFADGPIK